MMRNNHFDHSGARGTLRNLLKNPVRVSAPVFLISFFFAEIGPSVMRTGLAEGGAAASGKGMEVPKRSRPVGHVNEAIQGRGDMREEVRFPPFVTV